MAVVSVTVMTVSMTSAAMSLTTAATTAFRLCLFSLMTVSTTATTGRDFFNGGLVTVTLATTTTSPTVSMTATATVTFGLHVFGAGSRVNELECLMVLRGRYLGQSVGHFSSKSLSH